MPDNTLSLHPINLAVRFLLELAGLLAFGLWGWQQAQGLLRIVLAVGLPLLAAILWATFAVPDDGSRSGKTLAPVPGIVRLALELAFFAAASWALFDLGATTAASVFAIVVVLHYLVSYDRVRWLLRQ